MKAVYALYDHGRSAQRAVDQLKADGFTDDTITVITSEPREDCDFSHMHQRNWMWWIACGGGIIGFTIATAMLIYGETSWPIVVGGLPIVAWWPNLIIMFELTMFGAILATVITLVVTALWGDRKGTIYDPEVSDGKILVGIENPRDDAVEALRGALQTADDARVKVI